jgi:sarcosine oxidase
LVGSRDRTEREVDVLVIGGGVVGAAAALEAATRGARVALLERDSLGAPRGGSKGSARIYAPAAYPDEKYLEMGLRAEERWRELESRIGEPILFSTGVLSTGRFAERQLPLLRAAGVEAELLEPAEAERRFGIRGADRRALLHQPDAGVIRADRALRGLLQLARDAGAELRGGQAVDLLEAGDEQVVVRAGSVTWRPRAAIVAAGPWSGPLLAAAGIDVPLAVSSQTVTYFELGSATSAPPAVIDYDGDEPFVLWDPAGGLKAALHARGPLTDPDQPPRRPSPGAVDRLAAWVDATFPRLKVRIGGAETCLYTNTPDERFVVERRGRIVVAAACNGQGFQMAPETGRRVAALALEPAEVSAR